MGSPRPTTPRFFLADDPCAQDEPPRPPFVPGSYAWCPHDDLWDAGWIAPKPLVTPPIWLVAALGGVFTLGIYLLIEVATS